MVKTGLKAFYNLAIIISLLYFSLNIKMPVLYKIRCWEIEILLVLSSLLTIQILKGVNSKVNIYKRINSIFLCCILLSSISIFFYNHYKHRSFRKAVTNVKSSQLERIGKHFIIGYRSENFEDIKFLVSKKAIGGVYLTTRNIKGKTSIEIRKEIDELQEIQKRNNLPRLLVATDQEGGLVSRFSPPLTKLPSLSKIVDESRTDKELISKVTEYAELQSRELNDIGINLNFSPVVDLKNSSISQKLNLHTRTDLRAISKDSEVVTKVALIYSKISEKNGVIPTLKHFPGLSMVKEDTHLFTGGLKADEKYLASNDWKPFRKISQETDAFIMLGHVLLEKVDNKDLVSCSRKVITDIIRKKWNHNGILITDDLNMGPVVNSRGGIGGFSVRALNAGVDFLLISYDGEQYYKAIKDVIDADNSGLLNGETLTRSSKRIERRENLYVNDWYVLKTESKRGLNN